MSIPTIIPPIGDMSDFFGNDPIDADGNAGFWCYQTISEQGVELRFSFDIYERSVQTVVSRANEHLSTVSHEFADRIFIEGGKLFCECFTRDSKTKLRITIEKEISVEWTTIRVA